MPTKMAPTTIRNPDLVVAEDNKANWNLPDQRRWGFHNIHKITRYSLGLRAPQVMPLKKDIDLRIGNMPEVRRLTGTTLFSAMVVLRGQSILFETYAPDFGPKCLHSMQSITKSNMNLVYGRLIEQGRVDVNKKVSDYLPDIGSGYARATIQQVLNMDLINNFKEDYSDPYLFCDNPDATVGYGRQEIAMGWRLPPEGENEITCRGFVQSLTSQDVTNTTGEAEYRSPNTDVLGWIAERVSDRPLRDMLVEIVEAAGIEGTFYISTDRTGTPIVSGGGAMTARDLARYGQLFVRNGMGVDGKTFGSPAYFEGTLKQPGPFMPNRNEEVRYSNQVMTNGRWFSHSGYGGQLMLADPESGVSVAFFSVLENQEAHDEAYFPEMRKMAEEITLLDFGD